MLLSGIGTLKRINGNGKRDGLDAKEATDMMTKTVQDMLEKIQQYYRFEKLLTLESLSEIRSNLISIRHVKHVLADLNDFHEFGQLNTIFSHAFEAVSKAHQDAEELANELFVIAGFEI